MHFDLLVVGITSMYALNGNLEISDDIQTASKFMPSKDLSVTPRSFCRILSLMRPISA